MAVYLIGFALSTFLIAISEKKRTQIFAVASVLALLIPCLIAAWRADHVGTDVMVYASPLTDTAIVSDGLKDFLASFWSIGYRNKFVSEFELGYSLMVFVISKLTNSLPTVLFVTQALIITPIYLALARNRKKAPVWLGMLVFYLLFYNATLNMMRQWIAHAFMLLAFQLMTEKRYGWTTILSVISFSFHYSALLMVPIYMVYWFLNLPHRLAFQQGDLRITIRTLWALLISFVALVVIFNLDLILRIFSTLGIDRFNNYLEGNRISLLISQIVMRLPPLVLVLWNWKYLRKETRCAAFFLTMLLLDMVAAQLISVDVYAFRIGHYFQQFTILIAPALFACRKKGFERTTTVWVLIGYCLFYWYYTYIYGMRHGTYPYAFRDLLIL